MIRVLIADDHAIVREGIRAILAKEPDMRVEGEAANSLDAFQQARTGHWDVLVTDLAMPGRTKGLDLIREIKAMKPGLPVLVLSIHAEEHYGVHALKAGASGYLNKEAVPGELVKAIRKLAGGGRYISSTLAEVMAERLSGRSERPLHEMLSEREFEVYLNLVLGKTATEIARELALSVKTISTYRVRILEKLHLKNNCELIHYSIQESLLPASDGQSDRLEVLSPEQQDGAVV